MEEPGPYWILQIFFEPLPLLTLEQRSLLPWRRKIGTHVKEEGEEEEALTKHSLLLQKLLGAAEREWIPFEVEETPPPSTPCELPNWTQKEGQQRKGEAEEQGRGWIFWRRRRLVGDCESPLAGCEEAAVEGHTAIEDCSGADLPAVWTLLPSDQASQQRTRQQRK